MKKRYNTPEMNVLVIIENADIITASELKDGGINGSGISESLDDLLNDMY